MRKRDLEEERIDNPTNFNKIVGCLQNFEALPALEIAGNIECEKKSVGSMLTQMSRYLPNFVKIDKLNGRTNLYSLTEEGHQTSVNEMHKLYREKANIYAKDRKFRKSNGESQTATDTKEENHEISEETINLFFKDLFNKYLLSQKDSAKSPESKAPFEVAINGDKAILQDAQNLLESWKEKEIEELLVKCGRGEKSWFLKHESQKLTIILAS